MNLPGFLVGASGYCLVVLVGLPVRLIPSAANPNKIMNFEFFIHINGNRGGVGGLREAIHLFHTDIILTKKTHSYCTQTILTNSTQGNKKTVNFTIDVIKRFGILKL